MANRFPYPPPHLPAPNLYPPPPPVAPSTGQASTIGVTRLSTSVKLHDGSPGLLTNLQFPEPRPVSCILSAPLILQPGFVQQHGIILGGEATFGTLSELWILGEALVGLCGGTTAINFDIPLDQLVQFQTLAQTLKVSARLYRKILSTDLNYSRAVFSNPPPYQRTTMPDGGPATSTGNPIDILVYCDAGDGIGGGVSNLTRRQQSFGVLNGGNDVIVPPFNASMWRVLGDKTTTCIVKGETLENIAPGFQEISYGTFDANQSSLPQPLVTNMTKLQINNNSGATANFETVWSVGIANPVGM